MKETSSATTCGESVWLSCVMCGGGALGEVVAGVLSLPQDNTLFLTAGRNHSPLKPPPPLPVVCFQLSAHVLHRISLSIRVLLFLLLVVAGDVERNPGPPKPDPGPRG